MNLTFRGGGSRKRPLWLCCRVCVWEVRAGEADDNIIYMCGLCQECFIFVLQIHRALDNLVFGIGLPIRYEEYRVMWRIFVPVIVYHF